MERVLKQNDESANSSRVAQAKFTSKSRESELSNGIDDSPMMVAQRKKLQSLFGGAIQRVEDEEPLQGKFETTQRVEEEEPLQGKFNTVQRVEEEEPLQGKFEAVQRVEEEEPLQGRFAAESSATQLKESADKPNDTGLPDNLKSGIESLSGMSMDNVKVHYNSSQPAQLNALAYAQGTDIHVAPGQEQHLPHEAWHVVQQAQGRVKPTMQMKEGVPVNDDKSLEHEADVMGAKAVQMKIAETAPSHLERNVVINKPVQLKMNYGATKTLEGVSGSVHWHYSYDDTNINSLHLTIADTKNYDNRNWASRQSYTPTGSNSGNWTDWVNNHGVTPQWAITLAGNSARGAAVLAFHADQNIRTLLNTAYPQVVPDVSNENEFPKLK